MAFFDLQNLAGFATLAVLEIVLGIDNLVFISVTAARLPKERQHRARQIGLGLALFTRLALLAAIAWVARLTTPIFDVWSQSVSWRDLILLAGGLFLLYKGTAEIHGTIEGEEQERRARARANFAGVVVQIAIIDIVFSLDSVITAVGMSQEILIMAAAIVLAVAVMLFAAGPVGTFIERHPTIKMLAFSFLLLVGAALVADGLHFHIPRGYLYFAVGFSILVESLNLWASERRKLKRSGGN